MSEPHVRNDIRPGDLGAILEHHGRQYAEEYGVDAQFEGHVAKTLADAAIRGFPSEREAIRIVEVDGRHLGSIALTDDGDEATIRWFLFSPEVRGHGLGRRLLAELLQRASEAGFTRIALETFSDLEAAAHLYREHGFEVTSADSTARWGRERITYQRYVLELPSGVVGLSA